MLGSAYHYHGYSIYIRKSQSMLRDSTDGMQKLNNY